MKSARLSAFPIALAMTGAVLLSGCEGGGDAYTYAIPIGAAKERLGKSSSQYTTDDQTRFMRAAGWTEKGLRVTLSNSRNFSMNCEILFEEVSTDATRIVPDCGETPSAQGEVVLGMLELEAAAHVNQLLTGEPVDPQKLLTKQAVLSTKGLPAMQGEALAADAQHRAATATIEQLTEQAAEQAAMQQGGWGSDAGASPGSDWGN